MRLWTTLVALFCIALCLVVGHLIFVSSSHAKISQEKNLEEMLIKAQQNTSVAKILSIGPSIEYYIMDFPNIGAPKVKTIQELISVLKKK